MKSWPMTMMATMDQKPWLIFSEKMLFPVSNQRVQNIYQKCVQTKMEKSSVAS